MITEVEFKKAFDQAVHSFLLEEIRRRSLANKIGEVKVFGKGSKLVVEREGEPPIEIEPKEHTAKAILRKEYILHSDFDMIGAFFETLATKMADQQNRAIIEELVTHAGTKIDAKGDILGGLIEAAKQMRKKGYVPEAPALIANREVLSKLRKALEDDPERAELLRKLLSKEE